MGLMMPFDPSNPGEFREILQKLFKKNKLVSDAALHLVDLARNVAKAKNKAIEFPPKLSRSTLDRFRDKGTNTRNISGLSELWNVLENHEIYGYAFQSKHKLTSAADLSAFASIDDAMAFALSRYFTENINRPPKWIDMGLHRGRFIGCYRMYWPTWMLGTQADDVMTSLVEIVAADYALRFSETQRFPKSGKIAAFVQRNSGFMFSFAKHAHFLVAEEKHGTTLRLGAIEKIFEYALDEPIQSFFGKIYGISHITPHILSKFYCQRIDDPDEFKSEIMKRSDIPDLKARAYFRGKIKVALSSED